MMEASAVVRVYGDATSFPGALNPRVCQMKLSRFAGDLMVSVSKMVPFL
jgi:hypothetical protein